METMQEQKTPSKDVDVSPLRSVSHKAATLLCNSWYLKSGYFGLHLFSVGRFRGSEFWQTAISVEALVNHMDYVSKTKDFMYVVRLTFSQYPAEKVIQTANGSFDDVAWWALAYLRVFEFTGEEKYKHASYEILDYMMSNGWTDKFGGGMIWDQKRHYKNAITNELALMLSAKLCFLSEPQSDERTFCFEAMMKIWKWFEQSGMINQQNLINDGLTNQGENNGQTTWTYNQGVILGALGYVYKVTTNEDALTQAQCIFLSVLKHLCAQELEGDHHDVQILQEPCEVPENRLKPMNQDQMSFKGIFMRYLVYFIQQLPENSDIEIYRKFVIQNCASMMENSSAKPEVWRFGSRWTGPFDKKKSKSSAAIQTSAVDLLNSAAYFEKSTNAEKIEKSAGCA